jgi:glycerol-3-phosphate acyltransferase PlsX
MSMVIAVDAMGGDRAPGAAVEGAVLAATRTGVGVLLVGPEAILEAELARHDPASRASVRVLDAPEVVAMHE